MVSQKWPPGGAKPKLERRVSARPSINPKPHGESGVQKERKEENWRENTEQLSPIKTIS